MAGKNLTKHFLANTWPFFMGFISFEMLFIASHSQWLATVVPSLQ